MNRILTTFPLLALLLALACSAPGGLATATGAGISNLDGTPLKGVTWLETAGGLEITIDRLPVDGTFLSVVPAVNTTTGALDILDDPGVLGLAMPVDGGWHVGLVPTSDYAGGPINLELEYGGPDRTASVPPVGVSNLIEDLTVSDAGDGQVELSWTQVNAGDYNFDGLVGVQDLTPIGQLYDTTYDRGAATAPETRAYWVDGSADGRITVADITAIGQNYGAFIAGYNIYHNGARLGGSPTVAATTAQPRSQLPPVFTAIFSGSPADDWQVVSVDGAGIEGAGSGGEAGDVSLRANINITGLDLFDLDGTNPGAYAPAKSGSRIIDPIEIIEMPRLAVTPVATPLTDGAAVLEFAALPVGKLLYLDVFYLPTVNLSNGSPRSISTARGTSATPPAGADVFAVPFEMPAAGVVEITADVAISPSGNGGYLVALESTVAMPGDDPATPAVENGYVLTNSVVLDYANGLVSSDTDGDGDFEDEAELGDDDRDCVSSSRTRRGLDDDDDDYDESVEVEIEGTVAAFDEAAGTITLSNPVLDPESGEEIDLTDPLTISFSELTRFEEKVKQSGDDIVRDIDPSTIVAGDFLKIDLYALEDFDGLLPVSYWVEKVEREIDEDDGGGGDDDD